MKRAGHAIFHLVKRAVWRWALSPYGRRIDGVVANAVTELRSELLRSSFRSCGNNVFITFPVTLNQRDMIEIGDDVSINSFVHIWGGGGVRIGNRVMIGSHTAITSITHDHARPTMFDTVVAEPVAIDDDVWIGAHATILPGIRVGAGAVVAAGCVVTHDVPPGAIVAGVPGRVVRVRDLGGITASRQSPGPLSAGVQRA